MDKKEKVSNTAEESTSAAVEAVKPLMSGAAENKKEN